MKTTHKLLLLISIIFGCATIGYFTTHRQIQKKYKAIIFDMDGTTIDTDHLWKSGNTPILDSHAPHLTQEEKNAISNKFHELSIYDVWKCVQGHCSIDISSEEIIQENIKHLHIIYETQGIEFIPYFHDFHLKAKSYDLKTAIATSSQGETVDIITKVVPLQDYFGEHIYHADHVNRAFKPQPDVYLYAAKMLGVQPCDCIAIEDSSTGIKAAKAAGMYCIGINTGKNRNNLKLADEIVECFTEIDLDRLLK
jgi:beta-phosphoglucomutase-like phosphatase (HAD superfamily)